MRQKHAVFKNALCAMERNTVVIGSKNVGDARFRKEMIETKPLVWNDKEISASLGKQIGDALEMFDEIGLMLDAMRREDCTEFSIDDAEIRGPRNIMDHRTTMVVHPDKACTSAKPFLIEDVEIINIAPNQKGIAKRPDLQNRFIVRDQSQKTLSEASGTAGPSLPKSHG